MTDEIRVVKPSYTQVGGIIDRPGFYWVPLGSEVVVHSKMVIRVVSVSFSDKTMVELEVRYPDEEEKR